MTPWSRNSVAAKNVCDSFRFRNSYSMTSHGADENGLNWEDGNIAYHDLYTVVSEAVAGFAHLYCYDITQCKFHSELLDRPILNPQDFNCPQSTSFHHTRWCSLSCHKFPNIKCANRAFPFQLVDVPPADEILCKVPQRHDTSYGQICFSCLKLNER